MSPFGRVQISGPSPSRIGGREARRVEIPVDAGDGFSLNVVIMGETSLFSERA